jgi:Tol biopolymer transport system component
VTQLTSDTTSDVTPAFSPDSSLIVFASNPPSESLVDINTDIYMMQRDGSGLTQLTSTADRIETRPAFTPDGSRITYIAYQKIVDPPDVLVGLDNPEIWVMDASGAGAVRITNNPAWDDFPVFRGSR